jgi:hypothetical protein
MSVEYPWTTKKAIRARMALKGILVAQQPHYSGAPTVNVEAFLGLTNWARTSEQAPPHTGWWKTRRVSSPLLLQPQRRWWDGKRWSPPVLLVDSDDTAEASAGMHTGVPSSDIEWCGLRGPHPLGYSYKFYHF